MKFGTKLSRKFMNLPHYKRIDIFRSTGLVEEHEIHSMTNTELRRVTFRRDKREDIIQIFGIAIIEGGKVENGSAKAEGFNPIYRQ